ncbi:MAG: type IX secretion system sortase PorU [Bacteroidales bacterium]|nr:type IX secretion system sortase PorU [Bacteroidales bacterium]
MKTIFNIILLILISNLVFAQQQNYHRKIKWNQNIISNEGNEPKYFLSFNEAAYVDLNTFLPYYTENFKLENGIDDLKVKLEDLIFDSFEKNEIENIESLENISEKIKIQSSINYERKKPFLNISFVPVRKNPLTGKFEKLIEFTIVLSDFKSIKKTKKYKSYVSNSVLNSGKWVKIKVKTSGIYKITYSELVNIGISNPQNIRIYGNGGKMLPLNNASKRIDDLAENAIRMEYGSDGVFNNGDYILFYAQGPVSWEYDEINEGFFQTSHLYSYYSYYYLTSDLGACKPIITENSVTDISTNTVTTYDNYACYEKEDTNLIKSGRTWYGEKFTNGYSLDFNFSFPNRDVSFPVKLTTHVAARSSNSYPNSIFNISMNSQQNVQSISIAGVNVSGGYLFGRDGLASSYISSQTKNIKINITFNGGTSSSSGWLDYILINTRDKLNMQGSQMKFRDAESVGISNISEFTLSNSSSSVKIWDITDIHNIKQITSSYSNNITTFRIHSDSLREFVAFDGSSYLSLNLTTNNTTIIANQNLHGLNFYDMFIITHPKFISYANELAQIHEDDGLSVLVIKPSIIYNEFSSGTPDVAAIRDFIKMFYDKATNNSQLPKYLLLFGDGSYNNKSSSNSNYILTYQSANSLDDANSFSCDDFYGLLDDDEGGDLGLCGISGYLDIGIGRFPVQNTDEAKIIIDKIKRYKNNSLAGDWQNMLCFIADDADEGQTDHMYQANTLAEYVKTNYSVYNIDKIFLDSYTQISTPSGERYPDVTTAINNRIHKGSLIVNYTGHGNPKKITHEQVILVNDVLSWNNQNKLPIFVTASCEISRYDDYTRKSIGEHILLNQNGGGIALLTTTRVVYAGNNMQLNQNFYHYIFEKNINNEYYRFGDVVRLTKNATGTAESQNKRNFTLLGDPALKITIPKNKVITTKINNDTIISNPDTLKKYNNQIYNKKSKSFYQTTDTIKALSKVTVSGIITNENDEKLTSINGTLYPTIFDKGNTTTTLSNDGASTLTYKIQNNIIYKGKASIKNGEFSFSFIVPKDISYIIDYGKISYFASTSSESANGYFNEILIGGSVDSATIDNIGPYIQLFLNDSNFVFGGITDENPVILAIIEDSTGINTVGNGIGHDITAIIDNNTNQTIVLNDYYEANLDSYQKGGIQYNLSNIPEGNHNLKLKVWDVYNNSSEEYLEFIVSKYEEFKLDHVFNYPNPFTTNTDFYFDHNQPNNNLNVLIQIFTVTGKLIKTIDHDFFTDGYRSPPINWDGLDDFGDKIGRGVYVYRIKVRNQEGKNVEKFEKLVILR